MANIKTECRNKILNYMKDKTYKETKQPYQTKVSFSNDNRMVAVHFTPTGNNKPSAKIILENTIEADCLIIFPSYGGGYFDFDRETVLCYLIEYFINLCIEEEIEIIKIGRHGSFKLHRRNEWIETAWSTSQVELFEGLGFQPIDGFKEEIEEIRRKREVNPLDNVTYPKDNFLSLSVGEYRDNLWVIQTLKDYIINRTISHPAEQIFYKEFNRSSLFFMHFVMNDNRSYIYTRQEGGQLYLLFNNEKTPVNNENILSELELIINSIYEESKVLLILNPPTDKLLALLNIHDIKISKDEAVLVMEQLAAMNFDALMLEDDFARKIKGMPTDCSVTRFLHSDSFILQYKDKFIVGLYKEKLYSFIPTESDLEAISYISEYYNELKSKTIELFSNKIATNKQ